MNAALTASPSSLLWTRRPTSACASVSATYAVAHALAGKARQAADYAAYATVYGEGGYGAVADPASFAPEFQWQLECLAALADAR